MKSKIGVLTIGLFLLLAGLAEAQIAPVDKNKIANGGYDVVAYFTDGKAEKGNKEHVAMYNGAKYMFASEEHKQLFKSKPENYLPQCDGYCAYAVASQGTKVPINPETFKVIDGKLYLFFNGPYHGKPANALPLWNKDEANLLKELPGNWEKLMIESKVMGSN